MGIWVNDFRRFRFLLPFSPPPHTLTETIKQDTTIYPWPDKEQHLYRSFNQLLGSVDLDDDKIEEMKTSVRQLEEMGSFMFS